MLLVRGTYNFHNINNILYNAEIIIVNAILSLQGTLEMPGPVLAIVHLVTSMTLLRV
jgi:hypothetical protein